MNLVKKPAVRMLFVASGLVVTALLSLRGAIPHRVIGLVCSLVVLLVLTFRFKFLEKTFQGAGKLTVTASAGLALLAWYRLATDFYHKSPQLTEWFTGLLSAPAGGQIGKLPAVALAAAALPALFVFICYFTGLAIPFAKSWIARADRVEKVFLSAGFVLLSLAVIIAFLLTTVFYDTQPSGYAVYDVVYTTDSSVLMDTNTYQSVNAKENDIRHPLFGLFAMPFGLLAGAAAKLLFFVPNAYPICIGVIQTVPLLCGLVTLARIMRLEGSQKTLFLILSAAAFPVLLYVLPMERYVFTFFWLILFIYGYIQNEGNRELRFVAATGATLTSGILFPLLTGGKPFKERIRDIAACAVKFFAVCALFGQLPLFLNAVSSLGALTRFAGGGIRIYDRLLQFLRFVASCFIAPSAGVITDGYPVWRQEAVTSVSLLGVVLLIAAAAGFILNRKERFAQICAGWVLFSIILLFVAGWGTAENGLVLYTLYFSWAYLSLIFLLAEKVFAQWKPLRISLYGVCAAAMLVVNIPAIAELVRFGIQYYPVNG